MELYKKILIIFVCLYLGFSLGVISISIKYEKPKIEHKDTIVVYKIDTIDNTDYKTIDSLKSELLVKELYFAIS